MWIVIPSEAKDLGLSDLVADSSLRTMRLELANKNDIRCEVGNRLLICQI